MEITITETKRRKINLSDKEAAEIALNYIKKEFNISPQMWISDGKLMEEVEYVTSHVWHADEVVREATEEDICLLKATKEIFKRAKTYE
jgi:hypothetical protein